MTDTEIALADTIKIILEVLISSDSATVKYLAESLIHQRDHYLSVGVPNAALLTGEFLKFVNDEQRQKDREQFRQFLSSPDQGSA